ncbi:hypothetical protein ACH3XW_10690 [Acanthocheilonema viteae]|uniref:Uncharacterized protein n=1 Tax=Acanthocheilonema viteae TaxID=6277 RepID=A0A498SQ30_ACAVI|nr:unnamed protein product [Acanthocheilonema viteae]
MNAKSERPNCSNDIVRNAQLDVAEELRKQQLEIERVNTALSVLKKMESIESEEDLSLDKPYEFRDFRAVHEELNQYMALVQHVISLTKQCCSKCSKHEYVADNFVEKGRDDCSIRIGLGYHNATPSTIPSQNLTDSRTSRLAITPTTTVHVSPGLADAQSKCSNDNSLNIRPKEVLVDARQSVQNQRVHSASEPGSLLQLIQPTVIVNQKPHPFLSQAGSDSHSLHAAMQNVLGSLKRTLPGFHPIASPILNSDAVDFISAFSFALRRYNERVRSQIKLLLEKYDSSINSIKRSELVCEIDHLHKISRSASIKRRQLLDIIHGPYYQAVNCPPLRQMKILHSIFSSNSS